MTKPLSNNIVPPIPEPSGISYGDRRTFRLALGRNLLGSVVIVGSILTAQFLVLLPVLRPGSPEIKPVLFTFLFFFVCSVLILWFIVALRSVVIDSEGIEYFYDFIRSQRLEWNDITAVRCRSRSFPRSILILERKGGGRAYKLPFDLANRAGFIAAVREFAPPDNALRRYLEINVEPLKRDTMSR